MSVFRAYSDKDKENNYHSQHLDRELRESWSYAYGIVNHTYPSSSVETYVTNKYASFNVSNCGQKRKCKVPSKNLARWIFATALIFITLFNVVFFWDVFTNPGLTATAYCTM